MKQQLCGNTTTRPQKKLLNGMEICNLILMEKGKRLEKVFRTFLISYQLSFLEAFVDLLLGVARKSIKLFEPFALIMEQVVIPLLKFT